MEKEYNDRHEFWNKILPEGDMKKYMTIVILFSVIISKSITNPLFLAITNLERISNGDFSEVLHKNLKK